MVRSGSGEVGDAAGERRHDRWFVVDAGGAIEGEADLLGALRCLDVDVEQHFEMIGDEPDRADDDAVDPVDPVRLVGPRPELVEHSQDVGTGPGLGRATG